MKKLKVVTVCGCGMGSSVILTMNTEKALKEFNIPADVSVSDITTSKGAVKDADLVIIGSELAKLLKGVDKPIITLKSFVNKNEVKEKLQEFLKEKGML